MQKILAFDVYGTLINPAGIEQAVKVYIPDADDRFIRIWRQMQLEYSFRRGLMQSDVHFAQCTAEAFDFTCEHLQISVSDATKAMILAQYRLLPAFEEVPETLEVLSRQGNVIYAFSNGRRADLESLFQNTGILSFFEDLITVEAVGSFKPDPAVYRHLLTSVEAKQPSDCCLISGNSFDVIGALNVGLQGIWVRRQPQVVFDPWGIVPSRVIQDLRELC